MLPRFRPDQPDIFAFTPADQAGAEAQTAKHLDGLQGSAIIGNLYVVFGEIDR